MNIAHIESSLNWGGQELRIVEQSEWLKKHGHNVWILAREGSEILKEANKRGLNTYTIDLRGSVNPLTIRRLSSFVKKNNIDILDCHSNRDASYAMFAKLFTRVKVIRSRHVTDKIRDDFFHKLVWKYGNDHIITTAYKIKKDIIRLKLATPEKIDVALAGVDEKRFHPSIDAAKLKENLSIPKDNIVISNIGMIRHDKGQLFFVKACIEIAKEFDNVTFLQIGEATNSTKGYKQEVLNEGERLIKEGRLKFLGYHSDIENYIALSDIIVIASIGTEAQTRLVSQAFLMKKNVVATDIGGLPEMIQDGKTGLLCKAGNPESIKEAVSFLIKNEAKRKELQDNAYSYAQEYMTFDKMMNQVLGIYEKTLFGK